MKRPTISILALVVVLLFAATGCRRTPEDIEKWRAAGDTRKLTSALNDTRQFIRIDAIDALAEIGTTDIVEPLAELFDDDDLFIAHKAMEVLAARDDPAIEELMLGLLDYKTDKARATAIRALGRLKSKAAVDPLITALDDRNEVIVVAAAKSLGQIGDMKAVEPLSLKMDHRSYDIRMAGVVSLGQLGGAEATVALVQAMGNFSGNVRQAAVENLTAIGPSVVPLALEELRDETHFSRESAVAVLQRLNAVPSAGSDAVWYRLASLTAGMHPEVSREKAAILAVPENLDILLEAAAHKQPEIRDYAILALETLGEPVVSNVLAAAEQVDDPITRAWLDSRSKWSGAPAWELDLWTAAAALNPDFVIDSQIVLELRPLSQSAVRLMKSDQFAPGREYVPEMIAQLSSSGTNLNSSVNILNFFNIEFIVNTSQTEPSRKQRIIDRQRIKQCRQLAMQRLIEADFRAEWPLAAALNDDDLETAAYSAETLVAINRERAEPLITESITARLDQGEKLSGTPLHHVMLNLGLPAIDALVLKIRPDEVEAIKVAGQHYPDVRFRSLPLGVEIDPALKAAPFKLSYSVKDEEKELRIVFRPDEHGDWIPNPPLPDTLPE